MKDEKTKKKPLFLKLVYILCIVIEIVVILSYIFNLAKALVVKEIVFIGIATKLTLSNYLLTLTLDIYGIIFLAFILILVCALITLIYRKLFKIKCDKVSEYNKELFSGPVKAMLINNVILIAITVFKCVNIFIPVINNALSDSVAGPLTIIFFILPVGLISIMVLIVEIFLTIMIPFCYKWSIQMIKFIRLFPIGG